MRLQQRTTFFQSRFGDDFEPAEEDDSLSQPINSQTGLLTQNPKD